MMRSHRARLQFSRRGPFAAPVATLTLVAFFATMAPRTARAAGVEESEPADTPNFAENANGVHGGVDAAGSTTKATKARKAPVSAKGSFAHSLEIQVPPGRLGMTPSLALAYDSGSVAESAVGVGWTLGVPMISRSTRTGFPKVEGAALARHYDESAAVFTGPTGELVPATDGPPTAGTMYMPAREASPVRYERLGDEFVEHLPSGTKRYYGRDPFSSLSARIKNELGTHAWLLMREEDRHGNHVIYTYHNSAEQARANLRAAQTMPILSRVDWGGNRITGQANCFYVQTTIEGGILGPVNLLEGNTVLAHRIRMINVGVDDQPTWTYWLDYTSGPETGKSLLSQVRVTRPEGDETTTFTYSSGAPSSGPRFVDMGPVADGTPVYTNSSRFSESIGMFTPARTSAEQAIQAPTHRGGTKFIDIDGNGTTDAVYHAPGIGTTATHVLWEESSLQIPSPSGLGTWVIPSSGPATEPSVQPETGLPYFPFPGDGLWDRGDFVSATLRDLSDLDGDGDADGVSLSMDTEIKPGTYVSLDPAPPGPHVDPPPWGQMRVRIATNTAISAGVQHAADQLVGNWPPGVTIQSRVYATPGLFVNSPLQYKVFPLSDVQIPVVDVNADGKPDLILLKHREDQTNYAPGGAYAVPHLAMMKLYGRMPEQDEGEVDDLPLEEEFRALVNDEHSIVLVDDDLLTPQEQPGRHVRLQTTAARLGIPELPGATTMHMLSAAGGIPGPGLPHSPPGPLPGWGPDEEPSLPRAEHPWWWPTVDPEGDVFIPLRDSEKIGHGGSGEILFPGEFRFVPRAYLMRGDATRGLTPEPDENASNFETSLQHILNKDSAVECMTMGCAYLPHANFNAFFADVNGDGLPDLISAEQPRSWSPGGNLMFVCQDGHRVHLNRGYAFESTPGETIATQGWADSSDLGSPLRLVANRDRKCSASRPMIRDNSEVVNPFQNPGGVAPQPQYPLAAMAQADINGDGRVDLIIAYRVDLSSEDSDRKVFLNTGRGFELSSLYTSALPYGLAVADNAPFPNNIAPSLQGWPVSALPDMARFVDLDNDGLVDIVKGGLCTKGHTFNPPDCTQAKWYRNAGALPDRLERIESTSGAWTSVEYESPKSTIVQIASGGVHPPATMRVVKTVRSAGGPVPTPVGYDPFPVQEIRLSYENFVRDSISNEVLGFEKVTSEFVNSFDGIEREHVLVTRTFDVQVEILDSNGVVLPVRHPLKGAPVSTVTQSGGWTTTELYEYLLEPLGTGVRVRPRRALHGDVSPSQMAAWTAEETTQFDVFGNAVARVTGNYDGANIAPAEQRRTVGMEYENRTGVEWQIGLITRQQKQGYSEDIDGNIDTEHVLGDVVTTYDDKGDVASTARINIRAAACDGPADDVRTFEYWPHGLLKVAHEPAGPGGAFTRDVSYGYDTKNLYVASAQTSVGRMDGIAFTPATTTLTVSFETDLRHGKTTRATDPNGAATTSTFDSRGRLLTHTGPANVVLESNVYTDTFPLSETSTITSDVGRTFQRRTQLDADGHALSVVEGTGTLAVPWSRKSKVRLDAFGRVVESFLPAFVATIDSGVTPSSDPRVMTAYDGFDRPTEVTSADGRVTSTAYEPRETTETNARSIATRRTYDAFGELVSVSRNPGGAADETSTHGFVRDGRGEIVSVTDGDGSIRRIERDAGGRIRFVTLPYAPGTAPTRFAMCHDVGDNLVRLESPAGRVVDVIHDELGRTLVATATDAGGIVVENRQVYDELVQGGLGRLTSKTDDSGLYSLSYDVYGRPRSLNFTPSERAVAGAGNLAATYGARFDYTPAGHLARVRISGLPARTELSYTRDDKGRAIAVDTVASATSTTLGADVVYDAGDRVTSARYGNGTSGEWTFNTLTERLDRIAYRNSANDVLAAVGHVYDPNDNLLEENREKLGAAGIFSQKLHTYDALDRLRTSNASFPTGNQSESYTFSPSGNLVTAGNDAYTYASAVTPQAASLIEDAAAGKQRVLGYDADGYLASDQETRADGLSSTRTLAFDPTGCMRSITREELSAEGTTTSASSDYTCGLDGRVVARATTKTDGSQSRRIDFAGLGEIRADEGVFLLRVPLHGSVSVEDARSLATGERVAELSGYLVSDARGTVLATTAFDGAAPDFTREAEYDAWGKKLTDYSSLSAPRHGFAGAEADEAVGTYSFGARSYDPTLRRWVSPDPLLAALPSMDESLGDNLNLYAYAGGNPVRRIDLTGFEGDDWASKLGIAVAGLAYGFMQGVTPGGVYLQPSPAAESPHAAVFQHWQGAGQILGGGVSVAGGVTLGGGALAAEGVSGGALTVPAAGVLVVSAVAVANGVAAMSEGMKNVQEAQAKGDAPAEPTKEDAAKAESGKESGSYTNTHESGKTYDGKGDTARSQQSGRNVEKATGDKHVATEYTKAPNAREAFKQESRRLDSHGGPKSPTNHNKIESPGKKMRVDDGELKK